MSSTATTTTAFEEYLVHEGFVGEASLHELRITTPEVPLGPENLVRLLSTAGQLAEDDGARALATFYNYPYIDLRQTTFDAKALCAIPAGLCRQYGIIAFQLCGRELAVAVASLDLDTIGELSELTHCRILVHFSTPTLIQEAIEIQYASHEILEATVQMDVSDILEEACESTTVKDLSFGLIARAIKERASDIHVEPTDTEIRVRCRIDGVLHEIFKLPLKLHPPLIARYKVMSQLDISETRHPQDGRILFSIGTRSYDIRLSMVPTRCGEKAVLRILDKTAVHLDLPSMSFSGVIADRVMNVISSPSGVIFITGPTGSGKTTTCYAMLNYLNTLERNIVTVEDPIEYQLPLINQIQAHHDIDLDFASILRSVLRQDPDIILVGEIRDAETARVAMEAALTGHLVLSTLHTNNAVQAVVRLVEMGVEPFLVAPTIVGVIGQRLVRRNCTGCRHPYEPDDHEQRLLGVTPGERDVTLFKGAGCEDCRRTGYLGRLALHELVVVSDEIRELIMKDASSQEIERAAYPSGYRPMRHDGLKKALIGLTTLEEVVRVTPVVDDFGKGDKVNNAG